MTESAGGGGRVAEFLATLEKLPPFRGVTFRGCAADAAFVRPGQSVVTQGVVATSRNLDVATENRTASALYAVLSQTGRDISPFSARRDELEVVLLPGTLLYLAETRRISGLDVRLVVELTQDNGQPVQLPDDMLPRFAETVESQLASYFAEPASEVSPMRGKFVG
ncbi:MAG: hypothetical protein ACRDOY_11460, partial [Nocardioidaceae bacterium]